MLKFFFWILLAANIVLFVFQQTYYDAPSPGKREPERLNYQYREDQVRLLSADEINRAIAKAKIAHQDIAAAGRCVEIGRFSKSEATGFEQQLPSLSLNPEDISLTPVQESSTYMVFVPPSADQKAAEAKITALKEKGIESYYLIKDQSKLRWAISLGVFKTRDAAANYAAEAEKAGVSDLQIAPRGTAVEKLVYRLNNLNEEQLRALETILGRFPGQSVQYCPVAQENPA
ncbi:SPOR domain-containing protein [Oxalobacter vibrioformis]|uniref:SPOR domain-containing protein n=1 Tax=Oxalobacter vibrioformis TaxID=933080 RepID=A0A9E9LUI3_9BURK|nr:SPOR domain-containing protein [Oxalobacter vibrioformis]WAW08972.1 SPOR domain-containing protein [Oxalobacter vibrioformis]